MHALALDLPNKGPWVNNGKTFEKIIQFISRSRETFDDRVDVNKIVLVGHSFGAVAAAVALAEGAPAMGAVFLDPAAISRQLPGYLSRIKKPVLILGADERVSPARNRDYFYRYVRSGIAELSIKNAIHDDGQFPSESDEANEQRQSTFTSAITSAVFSLSSTGKFDYAWASFSSAFRNGRFFNAKRK
jgi:pimeloyl-ACP methyl ester carboxylesterase